MSDLPISALNLAATGGMTDNQKMLVEMRFANQKKSVGLAYVFLLFTAIGHNFYLGRIGRGIGQLALCFVLVGFLWILIDLFLLAGMVRTQNQAIYNEILLTQGR